MKQIGLLVEPIPVFFASQTFREVREALAQGPVAVWQKNRWCLLFPSDALSYPETTPLSSLPLREVPIFSPDLSPEAALEKMVQVQATHALVARKRKLLGLLSLKRLLRAVQQRGQEAEDLAQLTAEVLSNLRAVLWYAPYSPGEACDLRKVPPTIRFLGPVEELSGYSPEAFRKDPLLWFRSIHPEDQDAVAEALRRVQEGEPQVVYECRFRRKDGRWIWVRTSLRSKPQGDRSLLYGIVEEITPWRQAQEVERHMSRIHRLIAELGPGEGLKRALENLARFAPLDVAVIWMLSPQGLVTVREWIHPEQKARVRALVEEFHKLYGKPHPSHLKAWSGTFRHIVECQDLVYLPDLERRAEEDPGLAFLAEHGFRALVILPLVVESGRSILLGLVSRQGRAFDCLIPLLEALRLPLAAAARAWVYEEELRAERRELWTVFQTVPEGLVLLDPKGRVVRANPLGRAYLEEFGERAPDGALKALGGRPLESFLRSPPGGRHAHELSVSTPRPRHFEVIVAPVSPEEPGIMGWVLILREVTEQRELAQKVQAQERLAAVGELAAGIAHDFNNLLTPIVGYVELLLEQDGSLSSETRRILEMIGEQGRKAARMIRQILDFARRTPREKIPLDLVPFVKEVIKFLRRAIPESIRIELEVGPEKEYWVEADPAALEQVITNLAVNARDAMPEGGEFRIRLSRRRLEEGDPRPFSGMPSGDWVVMEFQDTGVGIPPEHLPRIFEPFFTTKKGVGTGLGLAQAYGIVKQHGGYIDVKSAVGRGTTFIVYLPALAPKVARRQVERATGPAGMVQGHGEWVLVIEDDEDVRTMLEAVLKGLGYRVALAVDGEEGLRVLERMGKEVRVVLLDWVLPRMGGETFLREMRNRGYRIPVLVVTGYPVREAVLKEMRRMGVVAWMLKPILPSELSRKVAFALRQAAHPH